MIRNSQRQLAYVVITPPASGAMTGASSAGQTMYDISRMTCDFSACSNTIIRPTGTIIAPPTPWSTRIAASSVNVWLAAQPSDAAVNTAIAETITRR